MITLLEAILERSDGSYISPQDLAALDKSLSSWKERQETYKLIQTQENKIVEQVFANFQTIAPAFIQQASEDLLNKCRRDLSAVLRYCAIAMLFQDEEILKDRFLYWIQNITKALRHQKINSHMYQLLQQVIQQELPKENADLILPYLKIAHEWLSQ